jgi:mannonate dehydratase
VNERQLTRRGALCCGAALAAGLFTGLVPNPAAAFRNPCRGSLPADLARHDLVLSAFDGIDSQRLVDVHSHLLGTGDSGSGCSVNEQSFQWWHPKEVLRRKVIMNAACVSDEASVDRAYVERLAQQAEAFPAGARWWLFAFACAHDDQGRERADWTTFHVPNAYAAQVAAARPQRFRWVASVHPYAATALQDLDAAVAGGAVAVKWLPSAMNIDLRDSRCRPFYERLQRADLPLIVHCGEEKAAPGADREEFGNPLHVRVPLAAGVRVVMAHAASLGHAHDTDRRSAPRVASFDLFARLMDEPAHDGRLLGDISAVFQRNRSEAVWRAVLENERWHPRLLHGSDHPLPGVMPLFSTGKLVQAGLLNAAAAEPLKRIREHNPLLFDFVLKRHLHANGRRLPSSVFEARALTARAATVRPVPPTAA